MQELQKLHRVLDKKAAGARAHESVARAGWLDRMNALNQAREFNKSSEGNRTGHHKLDGTSKGAWSLPSKELGLPIKFVGVGEAAR